MSVQFGRWSFHGTTPLIDLVERVTTTLAPYGPDGSNSYHKDGVRILYRAFHTTKESRGESQPHVSQAGAVITWDGRLDNRAELIHRFTESLSLESADVSIVSAAYDQWGTDCFAKLVGDWTLSIWNPNERSLILAKDPIGTRHLYYSIEKDQVMWCTILDPLVLLAGRSFALSDEYIAGCLASFPAAHLTPYVGIDAVPPACFVRLRLGSRTISKYWDFDPAKIVRYSADAGYEEHFRTVFTEAVRRRLRSDSPILAELSGGMDSSSIVCIADSIITQGGPGIPRLDTLSYFSDSEPNWDERTYFTRVEDRRGRTGWHIDVSGERPLFLECENDCFAATPASGAESSSEASRQLSRCVSLHGNRVVLSGIGGDEIMGGVPTPIPELMDLLARAQWGPLARQLKLWALDKRKPWFHLFFQAAREFLPLGIVGVSKHRRPPSWLAPTFVRAQIAALTGYQSRVRLTGPLPSYQENISTFDALRRQVAYSPWFSPPLREMRYPYLDRDLLEFMYAIPREQCVRPGQRRSLMRRALAGIVPDEILNRKRKAFVVRAPIDSISAEWSGVRELTQQMRCGSLGIVDPPAFSEVLDEARRGREVPIVAVMRTLGVEIWLRRMSRRNVLSEQSTVSHRNTVDNPIAASVASGTRGKQIQPGRAGCS